MVTAGQVEGEDSNGAFQYVTGKNKSNRKRRKGRENISYGDDDEEKKLARRIDIISAQKTFLESGPTGSSIQRLLIDTFRDSRKDDWPTTMLTLGVGSVKASKAAQVQLAFLLVVRDKLQSKDPQSTIKVEAYDPVFDAEDEELLRVHGVEPSKVNFQGKYPLDHAVFVFMPHCTKTLYENILRANWSPAGLGRLWLCCNELDRYIDGSREDVDSVTPCIRRFITRSSVLRLPQLPSSHTGALNDLAMHRYLTSSDASVDALSRKLERAGLQADERHHTDGEASFFQLPEPLSITIKDPELL